MITGIRGYVGEFGSGKTLSLVWDALNAMYHGHRVISNFPIEGEYSPPLHRKKHLRAEFLDTGEKLRSAIETEENCIFCVDETAIYLPQYYWTQLQKQPEVLVKFHQVRHYDAAIWYTVQEFNESVKALRILTQYVYECDLLDLGIFKIFINKLFKRKYFEGMPTEKKYELYFRGMRIIYPSESRMAMKAYQTKFRIESSMHFEL
jgi:hypothetical protein